MQEEASLQYYNNKDYLMNVELLVLDDIGVQNWTEALMSEFYEIIEAVP